MSIVLTPEPGDRGVAVDYEAIHEGEVALAGREQRVCASREAEGSIELPGELRAAFEPYVPE